MYHRLDAPFWRRAFAASAIAWPIVLFAATWTSGAPAHNDAAYVGATLVYLLSSLICHQRPDRSFHLWGAQLPVCARCLGLYAGAAVATIAAAAASGLEHAAGERAVARVRPRTRPDERRSLSTARALRSGAVGRQAMTLWWLLGVTPTAVTLVFEWTTGITPSNIIRAAAGAPLGALVAWTVMRVR